jgi:RNA polymerase sigma factor (sigma-70 family)
MPSSNGDVNAAFAAYLSATDLTQPDLEYALVKSLEKYAKKIVWLTLHENRPEIVNESVHFVLAHLSDFRGEAKFSTWVFTIVRRLCYRELQRKITSKETLFSDFKDYQVEELATYELDGDAKMTLDRIRKTLSKDENELIGLKLQGYTHKEIAEEMGTTTSAIEGRWRRLCEKLRQTETNSTEQRKKKERLTHS